MNNTIQTILVILTMSFALAFLVRKYLWKSKKNKTTKACDNSSCGCD